MALLNSIIEFLMTVDIIAVPLGIIASIILAVQSRKTQDSLVKKSKKSWAWRAFLWPIGVLLLLIVIYGIAILARNTIQPQ